MKASVLSAARRPIALKHSLSLSHVPRAWISMVSLVRKGKVSQFSNAPFYLWNGNDPFTVVSRPLVSNASPEVHATPQQIRAKFMKFKGLFYYSEVFFMLFLYF